MYLHIMKANVIHFVISGKGHVNLTEQNSQSETEELKHDSHTQLAASHGQARSVPHDYQRTLGERGDLFLI